MFDKDYLKINKEAYNFLSEEYRERIKNYSESDKEIVYPFINDLKKIFGKVNVLELGPGSGLALKFFIGAGFHTKAVEISENIAKLAKETSPESEIILGDFLSYDFGNEKFEGIFAKAFIHLFPKEDAIKVLNKVYNLLKNKGLAYFATTVHEKSEEAYLEKSDYNQKIKRFRRLWNDTELIEEIENARFKIVRKRIINEAKFGKVWIEIIGQRIDNY